MSLVEFRPSDGRRALFVSYLFPPVGGVGVHRVTKFVKHLPQFGWNCSVLTVENPSTPLLDGSLKRDIPASTIICRAKTWEPSYALKAAVGQQAADRPGLLGRARRRAKALARGCGNLLLQPDAQILWRPNALREARRLLKEIPHHAIIATGPPFSSLLIGATLARQTGLPLILDYRDEWGISNAYWENKQHNWVSNAIQRQMQRRALAAASVVVATTPSSTDELTRLIQGCRSRAVARCIYNGFDPDDFAGAESAVRPRVDFGHGVDRCRLAFVGTLWNLNPIGPFVEGVLRFAERDPRAASRLEIVLAGRRTAEQEEAIARLASSPCNVVTQPFMAHSDAVRLMQDADSLLLINADKPETNRIINAKTFEYMAARRPMFVVAPEGDLWDVTRDLPGTLLCSPGDPDSIALGLAELVDRHRRGVRYDHDAWNIARFERRTLAGQLAGLLDQAVLHEVHRAAPPQPARTARDELAEEMGALELAEVGS
ncbi:MAG: glycosyltransferase [Planctomyces sp.]|nr:glycosyltransferase [Planctomyces sp.]